MPIMLVGSALENTAYLPNFGQMCLQSGVNYMYIINVYECVFLKIDNYIKKVSKISK